MEMPSSTDIAIEVDSAPDAMAARDVSFISRVPAHSFGATFERATLVYAEG